MSGAGAWWELPPYDAFADARKAASVIIVRERSPGFELLMIRRAERAGDPRGGAAVFPGGVLDARDAEASPFVRGLDIAEAGRRMKLASGARDYLVAASRECFEEVGLLFAGGLDAEKLARAHADWREPLQRGERPVAALCEALDLTLDFSGWSYWDHWLTPPGGPKRFDTRFFITRAPQGQEPQADGGEATELMWLTPAEALDPARGLSLLPVTRRTLTNLGRFESAQALLDYASSRSEIALTMPRRAASSKGLRVVLPGEHAYAEIGRLDPHGRGDLSAEIEPGRAVRLSARVIRVTAPNAGVMTGPGTNTYLVGDPRANRWTVIDPGPAHDGHLRATLAAAPGPVERILVTHTHVDHSPGAAALAAETGAPVLGRRPAFAAGQDASFSPTAELSGGETILLGENATLRVIHTPGHASNHLCYLLEEEKTLFTGDHVMQGSTVVINPPDGDMAAYFAALHALLDLDLEWLAPGHGFLVARPHDVVRALIAHRQAREDKVVAALMSHGPATIDDLVSPVYADVAPALHPVARRSLFAHLLKLRREGRAALEGEIWRSAA